MRIYLGLALLLCSAATSFAQLSTDQKVLDFQSLASLFAKQYAPYGWKRDVVKFDLLDIKPWIARVQNSKDDLEFYEICEEYVASLNDVHSAYVTPSEFVARLGFRTDIYDGKVLVDSIDRSLLPKISYPFVVGDEVVSIDGKSADDILTDISKLTAFANTRSTRRWAAVYLPSRYQDTIPRAVELGDNATVVIKSQTGAVQTYTIPWMKSGRPLITEGPVPSPQMHNKPVMSATAKNVSATPKYKQFLLGLQANYRPGPRNLLGFGSSRPVFKMPAGFKTRNNPLFYSGTFTSGGYTIGYIRIPDFEAGGDFNNVDSYVQEFDTEIQYFQANTDGLVVDVMRNPGGFGCYSQALASHLIPYTFRGLGLQFRPTISDVTSFSDEIDSALAVGAEDWQVALLRAYQAEIESAFSENRGITGPLPVCDLRFEQDPPVDDKGNMVAYTKPMILVTDEFTTSAGDIFASFIQDSKRGPLVGWRTSGAGGSTVGVTVGFYSDGQTSITRSLISRANPVFTDDFPVTNFIENVGVRPDVPVDYMTKENLLNGGSTFVNAITNAIIAEIQKAAPHATHTHPSHVLK